MAATGSAENGGKLGNRAGLILVSSIAYAAIMSPAPGISKVIKWWAETRASLRGRKKERLSSCR